MNMGTSGHPEGVQHWSNKVMYFHLLERYRRRQQGFWVSFKQCCGQCNGGGFVEDILADVTAVRMEADYGRFRPDILLERREKPPVWLEFTHTSPPSPQKLAYCSANEIDLFELDGSKYPSESSVTAAYIAPRNCRGRQRRRLFDLWQQIARLDDPVVGIREDFRSPDRQRREWEATWAKSERMRQDVAAGRVRCSRCEEPFAIQDGRVSVSFIQSHRPGSRCGKIPFCQTCGFAVRGGWDGAYPDDAGSWGLDEECPTCQPILAEHEKMLSEERRRRSVVMPAPYGSRVVQEPERRTQEYIVGNRTVSRSELQSILMMFEYVLVTVTPNICGSGVMLEEVDRIKKAVRYSNNILDWDWLEGMGESYVSERNAPNDSRGDKFLFPKRWWRELPPCPLTVL